MKSVLFSLSLLTLGLVGCSKFSEGPSFSIHSRKARLCNDWKLSDYVLNGNNVFDAGVTTKMSIDKDGTYSISDKFRALTAMVLGFLEKTKPVYFSMLTPQP
jgi:hypothetical protein